MGQDRNTRRFHGAAHVVHSHGGHVHGRRDLDAGVHHVLVVLRAEAAREPVAGDLLAQIQRERVLRRYGHRIALRARDLHNLRAVGERGRSCEQSSEHAYVYHKVASLGIDDEGYGLEEDERGGMDERDEEEAEVYRRERDAPVLRKRRSAPIGPETTRARTHGVFNLDTQGAEHLVRTSGATMMERGRAPLWGAKARTVDQY